MVETVSSPKSVGVLNIRIEFWSPFKTFLQCRMCDIDMSTKNEERRLGEFCYIRLGNWRFSFKRRELYVSKEASGWNIIIKKFDAVCDEFLLIFLQSFTSEKLSLNPGQHPKKIIIQKIKLQYLENDFIWFALAILSNHFPGKIFYTSYKNCVSFY